MNVVADNARGGPVLMLGAHLDSVADGPGVNDNGTGVAALLEIARLVHARAPNLPVRFAFWGGEEFGLFGSRAYAATARPDAIAAYLNFDMLGSHAGTRGVYVGPFESRFRGYFSRHGLSAVTVDITGRSDHFPFDQLGVPTGGLFSGDEACYHRACDRAERVDLKLFLELTKAAAWAAVAFAP
jgi:Zn-dependent M28 family amino/carboxypeptidase